MPYFKYKIYNVYLLKSSSYRSSCSFGAPGKNHDSEFCHQFWKLVIIKSRIISLFSHHVSRPRFSPKVFSNSLAVHVFHTCSGFFSLFPIWSPSPFTWIQRLPCATTVLAPNCSDRCSTQGLIASYTVKCGGGRKVRQRTPEIKLIMYLSVVAMNGLFSF